MIGFIAIVAQRAAGVAALAALAISAVVGLNYLERIGLGPHQPDAGPPVMPINGPPQVFYTDVAAGPTTGGENNAGTYLSIFGKNFGSSGLGTTVRVTIGGHEVSSYRYLGQSVNGRPDVGQITVQVGAIGNPAPGADLPIVVQVGTSTSNSDVTFRNQPGDILFVALDGNDSTAVKNDITRPWRHIQNPDRSGAMGVWHPGDTIVIRGGTYQDIGYGNRWARFSAMSGTAPNGSAGNGYLTIMAYPGEYVRYQPPDGSTTSGGLHGVNNGNGTGPEYVTISGLHIRSIATSASDACPINLQSYSNHWRVVNNELGPWPASVSAVDRCGGISGSGSHVMILGNEMHDIGGGNQNHGIYIDYSGVVDDYTVAWNHVHHVVSGNLIQSYMSDEGTAGAVFVHHNVLHDGGRFGLNIADGTEDYAAWNNVIYRTAAPAIRFNAYLSSGKSITIAHNTIYEANRVANALTCPIINENSLASGTTTIKNNIFVSTANSHETAYWCRGDAFGGVTIRNNMYCGLGSSLRPPDDSRPIACGSGTAENPGFMDSGAFDFSLTASSPAINAASVVLPFTVTDDAIGTARSDGHPDVGAYER